MADSIGTQWSRGESAAMFDFQTNLRHYWSDLPRVANNAAANTSGTAYWLYMGFCGVQRILQGITMQQTVQATVSQAAEYCFASTPLAPNRATQSLTPIAATASLTDMLGAASSLVRPSAAMNAIIPAGTHLWVGFRQAMGGTQAGFECVFDDLGQGCVLQTAASGVLTGAGPFTGVVPAFAGAALAPFMLATQD